MKQIRAAQLSCVFSRGWGGVFGFFLLSMSIGSASSTPDREEFLRIATQAGDWTLSREVQVPNDGGSYFPSRSDLSPEDKGNLYYGNAGILLFFRELYQTTGRPEYAEAIKRGARFLNKNISDLKLYGLYDGLAGIAFSLAQFPEDPAAAAGCSRALGRLALERSHDQNGGTRWNNDNDVISGSAGVGLTLLALGRQLERPDLIDLAVQAGTDLLAVGQTTSHGRYWFHELKSGRQYPNFSHGTAGIAFFLLRLYEETGENRFLVAALDGAHYLQSIASVDPPSRCLIPHDLPGGETLFYLSWCHGPAGTGRFFHELSIVTRDPDWQRLCDASAQTMIDLGVPEHHTRGYWDNVSRCCGAVGMGEYFLARFRASKQPSDRQLALRIAEYLSRAAEPEGGGLKWTQAENRIEPDNLLAQTGLMQGAAGIGLFFLHVARSDDDDKDSLPLPDSSW
ncbi:MAG: hypothetical protein JO333_15385 [Verrucomicrobia bacterium]|nr:hypothetical protein [Verrucomicrobiota bacterium]